MDLLYALIAATSGLAGAYLGARMTSRATLEQARLSLRAVVAERTYGAFLDLGRLCQGPPLGARLGRADVLAVRMSAGFLRLAARAPAIDAAIASVVAAVEKCEAHPPPIEVIAISLSSAGDDEDFEEDPEPDDEAEGAAAAWKRHHAAVADLKAAFGVLESAVEKAIDEAAPTAGRPA